MKQRVFLLIALLLCVVCGFANAPVLAQQDGFSVQVTPSPIIETLQPGISKTIELKIRNTSTQPQELKMSLRSFTFDTATGQVQLQDTEPADVKDWVQFENPIFSVAAGEWFTQKIQVSPPQSAGFSYSFAITVSRSKPQSQTDGKAAIEGSVAVFTLLNIDRPDAKRQLEIVRFSSQKKLYEYLPVSFTLRIKNSGNTIVRPAGNVYIQRTVNSTEPLSVLPLNETGLYTLASTERDIIMSWKDGFPVYQTVNGANKLVYNWGDLQKLRIGKYTAKAIVVYNDGQRDVPVETDISFWVVPWKLLLGALLVLALVIVGVVTIVKKIINKTRKSKPTHDTSSSS